MKKSYIYIAAISAVIAPQISHAASTCNSYDGARFALSSWSGQCPNAGGTVIAYGQTSSPWDNCKTKAHWCYTNASNEAVVIMSCTECNSGYTITTALMPASETNGICSNTIQYQKCVKSAGTTTTTCDQTECTAQNNTYYNYDGQYQIAYKYNCNNGSCVKNSIVSYRCAQGYYGPASSASKTGCTQCPSAIDKDGNTVYGSTQGGGKTSATDCFLPPATVLKDQDGEYVFTSMCKYTN